MGEGDIGDNSAVEVDFDELAGFLQELGDKQHAVSEATGFLRSRLRSILDEKGWNNSALAMIRTLHNKSETARADCLRTFVPMFEVMLEYKWRAEMSDMLDENEDDTA